MKTLYRSPGLLPSLLCLALTACENPSPPEPGSQTRSNVYAESLREAEALRQTVDQRNREQQQIDTLLGRGQPDQR